MPPEKKHYKHLCEGLASYYSRSCCVEIKIVEHASVMNAHMLIAQTQLLEESHLMYYHKQTNTKIQNNACHCEYSNTWDFVCENNEKHNTLRITCEASGSRLGHSCRASDPSWSKHSYESYIIEQIMHLITLVCSCFNELGCCEYVISTNRWPGADRHLCLFLLIDLIKCLTNGPHALFCICTFGVGKMFFEGKEVSSAHQLCINWIKSTVKTVILWNIITIWTHFISTIIN